jgi:hypothetical protein
MSSRAKLFASCSSRQSTVTPLKFTCHVDDIGTFLLLKFGPFNSAMAA